MPLFTRITKAPLFNSAFITIDYPYWIPAYSWIRSELIVGSVGSQWAQICLNNKCPQHIVFRHIFCPSLVWHICKRTNPSGIHNRTAGGCELTNTIKKLIKLVSKLLQKSQAPAHKTKNPPKNYLPASEKAPPENPAESGKNWRRCPPCRPRPPFCWKINPMVWGIRLSWRLMCPPTCRTAPTPG